MIDDRVNDLVGENYSFSVKLNEFSTFVNKIKEKYNRIVLYGFGVSGKIISEKIGDKVVGVLDENLEYAYINGKNLMLSFEDLYKVDTDCILITVLGRELEIISFLKDDFGVSENIISVIDLSSRLECDDSPLDSTLDSIVDLDKNLIYNKERWGSKNKWLYLDRFGYSWNSDNKHSFGSIAKFSDQYLRPYTGERYDLDILELSPGGGRFTAEVIRYAKTLDLVDMNQACLDICKERFSHTSMPVRFFKNDGRSLSMLSDYKYDLIVCFDSMVHMHPDIIEGYIQQFASLIRDDGYIWLDHSGKGIKNTGHRTDMSDRKIKEISDEYGLRVVEQFFRNKHDCISVLMKK